MKIGDKVKINPNFLNYSGYDQKYNDDINKVKNEIGIVIEFLSKESMIVKFDNNIEIPFFKSQLIEFKSY